jgi:C4-dicarboxylate transporter DctM subunit
MEATILFITLFILLIIGVPIGVALAISMLALIFYNPVTPATYIAQSLYSGVANFTLLSLPFFIIAGNIMETGGISKRLVNVANGLIGNITGGLGYVAIISCMLFGAVSGSAPATVAAIGTVMLPEMVRNGYDKVYATALMACAGGLGVIVPPSYPMVVYGVTNDVSIGTMFMAGFLPAVVVGLCLGIVNYFYSKKKGYKGSKERQSLLDWLKSVWEAKWALLMPVIILGGIYSGVFTPTEAAVVATVYGLVVGAFIYKEFDIKNSFAVFKDSIASIGGMIFVFAPAAAMGSIFAYIGFPEAVKNFFLGISTNPNVILIFIYILMFFVGMFVQTTPAIVILSPILLTVVKAVGIDPVHFGIIMVITLCIAFVSPPVAVNLFVATSMTGISIDRITVQAIKFIIALFIALVLIGAIPEISLLLPRLL